MKVVLYTSFQKYFEKLRAGLDTSYRFYADDWDIQSHTFKLAWRQRIGENWVLAPFARYYRQSAAEFYRLTLDGTGIDPHSAFDSADGPHYSADYRLSKMETTTIGIKANWFIGKDWKIDLAYEVYNMEGLDNTPAAAYLTAKTYTIGISHEF